MADQVADSPPGGEDGLAQSLVEAAVRQALAEVEGEKAGKTGTGEPATEEGPQEATRPPGQAERISSPAQPSLGKNCEEQPGSACGCKQQGVLDRPLPAEGGEQAAVESPSSAETTGAAGEQPEGGKNLDLHGDPAEEQQASSAVQKLPAPAAGEMEEACPAAEDLAPVPRAEIGAEKEPAPVATEAASTSSPQDVGAPLTDVQEEEDKELADKGEPQLVPPGMQGDGTAPAPADGQQLGQLGGQDDQAHSQGQDVVWQDQQQLGQDKEGQPALPDDAAGPDSESEEPELAQVPEEAVDVETQPAPAGEQLGSITSSACLPSSTAAATLNWSAAPLVSDEQVEKPGPAKGSRPERPRPTARRQQLQPSAPLCPPPPSQQQQQQQHHHHHHQPQSELGEGRLRPLARPKAAQPGRQPPALLGGLRLDSGSSPPATRGPPPAAACVFPTGFIETEVEERSDTQCSSHVGYSVAEFAGIQWAPRRATVKTANGSEITSLDQMVGLLESPGQQLADASLDAAYSQAPTELDSLQPALPSGFAREEGVCILQGEVAAAAGAQEESAAPTSQPVHQQPGAGPLGQPGTESASPKAPAYSILHRNRSLDAHVLQRGQRFAEVAPGEMFRAPTPPPEPEPALEQELPPVEPAPMESPPRAKRQVLTKPSVSEIYARAGVRVKHKQEGPVAPGLKTSPPRWQPPIMPGMGAAPTSPFPDAGVPELPPGGLSWGASAAREVPAAFPQLQMPPIRSQQGASMAGGPAAKQPARGAQQIWQKQPYQATGLAAAPQQPSAQEYNIAASWPPYEGARLPALSPDQPRMPPPSVNTAGQSYQVAAAWVVPAGQAAGFPGAAPTGLPFASPGAPPPATFGYMGQAASTSSELYGDYLPPLPGAPYTGVPPGPWTGAPALSEPGGGWAQGAVAAYAQQQQPRQQLWVPSRPAGQAGGRGQQRGAFVARPSKNFHGIQARSRVKPQKYQDDGRPEFSLR